MLLSLQLPECGFLQEPGQSAGMVEVEMRDEEDVDRAGVHEVDEGERVEAGEAGVDPAVEEDRLVLELEHVT